MAHGSAFLEPAERSEVKETTLPPLIALSAVLLASWSVWAILVRPWIPAGRPATETLIGIAARVVFWLVPCGVYLWRYWGRHWHQPLGLGFPLGLTQVLVTAVVTAVVGALWFLGTAIQQGVPVVDLIVRFAGTAHVELTAPFFEELVFRGLLLGELINWVRDSSKTRLALRFRFWGVLVLSAAVFALVHWPYWVSQLGLAVALERTPPVLVTGLVLGFVFANTRSLWACVVLHWLNNQLSSFT